MGTKIDEAIICIQDMQLSYQKTGERLDYLDVAIETMQKYKTMQEVLEKVWNVPACMLDEAECLNKIMETYRTVR